MSTRRRAATLVAALVLGSSLATASLSAPCLAWADDNSAAQQAPTTGGQEEGAPTPQPEDSDAEKASLDTPGPAENSDTEGGVTEQPKTGWLDEDGARRYYDENGVPRKGWLHLDSSWYWLDESTGNMATGWKAIRGTWYWFDSATGIMSTSRTNCNGTWSDFATSGAWQGYASGWDKSDGSWHWLENGTPACGWRRIDGSWYWMDESGTMRTGWIDLGGTRYHLSGSGAMDTGWLYDNGSWYWMDPANGNMRTGWQWIYSRWYWADSQTGVCARNEVIEINSNLYVFGDSCAMAQNGWGLVNGTWYWAGQSGALESDWHNVRGSWYWMDPTTKAMATGVIDLDGTKYYLAPSGAMTTGWAYDQAEGCWYYAAPSSDGHLLTGWQWIGNAWYWMDGTTAKMRTGWLSVGGKTYHLSSSGAMDKSCWIDDSDGSSYLLGSDGAVTTTIANGKVTMADGSKPSDGLTKIGGTWFYLIDGTVQYGAVDIDGTTHLFDENTGKAITGWHVDENGIRHHYNDKGVMQTNCWVFDTYWYLLDENGVALTGWQNQNGTTYYLDPSTGAMKTGWLKDNGNWYWFNGAGAMATGWAWDGSNWYYMNANGVMQTGWLNLNGTWYWLDTASGAMGTGWIWDGSAYYFCASDGHWINVNVQWRDMFDWAQGYSSATNYLILVDTQNCRVGIYYGRYGAWAPVKEFICSPGAPSTPTVKGEFTVQNKGYVFGNGYSCYYYTQFYSDYLFHSVLYYQNTSRIMDGRLGQRLSHGCVRLAIENAKWIYDNVPRGSKVVIW